MSPASSARGWDRLVPAALVASLALLIAGLVLPVMTVDKFFVFSAQFSIIGSLEALWRAHEYVLFAAVGLFSVVFPILKLTACFAAWYGAPLRTKWIEGLGRWSMLDVFLLAILLVIIRGAGTGAHTEIGLFVFAVAVIGSILAARWFHTAMRRTSR
jgi:paraquat-inducible protein A